MTTVPLSLRVDPVIKEKLENMARNDRRSLSQMANIALESFLRLHEEKKDALELALEKAERELQEGVFVSGAAVDRWVDSWGREKELPVPGADIFPEK